MLCVGDLFTANMAMTIPGVQDGAAHSRGPVVYGTRPPNPSNRNFGFDETLHALTVIAFVLLWSAALLTAIDPPSPRS